MRIFFSGLVMFFVLPALGFSGLDEASGPIVYPKNGQTPEQQGQDANACRNWAMQQTGVDPAYLQGQLSVLESQKSGSAKKMPVARGAIRGVATGTALGAINGSMDDGAGKGAAMGVTAGAMRGVGERIGTAREAKTQQAQQQARGLQNQLNQYYRAFSACMQGRGYSVS